jgi:hypothetical protein
MQSRGRLRILCRSDDFYRICNAKIISDWQYDGLGFVVLYLMPDFFFTELTVVSLWLHYQWVVPVRRLLWTGLIYDYARGV